MCRDDRQTANGDRLFALPFYRGDVRVMDFGDDARITGAPRKPAKIRRCKSLLRRDGLRRFCLPTDALFLAAGEKAHSGGSRKGESIDA